MVTTDLNSASFDRPNSIDAFEIEKFSIISRVARCALVALLFIPSYCVASIRVMLDRQIIIIKDGYLLDPKSLVVSLELLKTNEIGPNNPYEISYEGQKYKVWANNDLNLLILQKYLDWQNRKQSNKLGLKFNVNGSLDSVKLNNENHPAEIPGSYNRLLTYLASSLPRSIQRSAPKEASGSTHPATIPTGLNQRPPSSATPVDDATKLDSSRPTHSVTVAKSAQLAQIQLPAPAAVPAVPVVSHPAAAIETEKPETIKLSSSQIQELQSIRHPLATFLGQYFQLDDLGYIVAPIDDQRKTACSEFFKDKRNYPFLIGLFYQVSLNGDVAYAEDIRTTLAGMDIASRAVVKSSTQAEGDRELLKHERPVSYTGWDETQKVTAEPPAYSSSTKKTAPAYIDALANANWKGNRDYRHRNPATDYKVADRGFTTSQLADYKRRVERVHDLHKGGLLVGRVADMREVKDFTSHRSNMRNDILSTTLWPKQNAPIKMELFSEFNEDTVGVLFDPTRAGTANFGVGFPQNAGTVGQGFLQHQERRNPSSHVGGIPGTSTIMAQKELLEALSTVVAEGGSVTDVTPEIAPDRKSYVVKKKDARVGGKDKKSKQVLWNEQTYNRGVARDFFTGFFVKSESDSFSSELKELFSLQDRIRRKKGIYVPIFQFKGSTNQLEEIIPDPILLNITGATDVSAIPGMESSFTLTLKKAGITQELALKVSKQVGALSPTAKSLFDLQLLMFNMKDISGKISVKQESGYGPGHGYVDKSIRMLDNLHLVFPTTFRTQNKDAKDQDSFFGQADVQNILANQALHEYLKATLTYNIDRFLGVRVDSTTKQVTFESKKTEMFDKADLKKSDFAKVLARSLQAALLFKIYGPNTNQIVPVIAAAVRKHWPVLGFTPSGIDMVLGNKEIQEILTSQNLSPTLLTLAIEPQKGVSKPIPPQGFSIHQFDPFKQGSMSALTQQIQKVVEFLEILGIDSGGTLDHTIVEKYRVSDPHLRDYETAVIHAIHFLSITGQGALATAILTNFQKDYPSFGKIADGKSMIESKSDLLMQWIQEVTNGQPPSTEFPFEQPIGLASSEDSLKSSPSKDFRRMTRRRADSDEEEEYAPMVRGRRGFVPQAAAPVQSKIARPSLTDEELILKSRELLPRLDTDQEAAARSLGLINAQGVPLWEVAPEFYEGNKGKPKAPYIAVRDLLGHFVGHLLSGPACDRAILQRDRDSFHIDIDHSIITKSRISHLQHLITDTLAVTTEGDEQVLRANGLQYSGSAEVPIGGNIAYNGGNEKHYFRSNKRRRYIQGVHNGLGAYTLSAIQAVEQHDRLLLSDEDRRIKRAGTVASAYVTVTAIGGYGSERKPLSRAYRVLYVATAGAQFEKYGRGEFTYQDSAKDANELESADFIIKRGAAFNPTPLIDYFDGKGIPAHAAVAPAECSMLDDGDFTKPFVTLKDSSYFNRKAFGKSLDKYVGDFILPVIKQRTSGNPYYVKATLFGGGFFADANKAGNLRSEVIYAMLEAYIKAIKAGGVPAGSVIEFPRYGDVTSNPAKLLIEELKAAAQAKWVEIVWSENGDVCDYNNQTTLSGKQIDLSAFESKERLVVLGASDAMSWHGNEPSSASVEAAFANNSNLRLVMNWWANSAVLTRAKRLVSMAVGGVQG